MKRRSPKGGLGNRRGIRSVTQVRSSRISTSTRSQGPSSKGKVSAYVGQVIQIRPEGNRWRVAVG